MSNIPPCGLIIKSLIIGNILVLSLFLGSLIVMEYFAFNILRDPIELLLSIEPFMLILLQGPAFITGFFFIMWHGGRK